MHTRLTPEMLLYGYEAGVFPMAENSQGGPIHWYAPDPRAVLPLDKFHIPDTLKKLVKKDRFVVDTNRDFEGVMRACAAREETWISDEIIEAYTALYRMGFAHSIECRMDDELVGGLYGVAIGGAFFGESMFHTVRDASKVALVHLVARLKAKAYQLLDTQYSTPHLARFGVIEIPREAYELELERALRVQVRPWSTPFEVERFL